MPPKKEIFFCRWLEYIDEEAETFESYIAANNFDQAYHYFSDNPNKDLLEIKNVGLLNEIL